MKAQKTESKRWILAQAGRAAQDQLYLTLDGGLTHDIAEAEAQTDDEAPTGFVARIALVAREARATIEA